MVGIVRLSRSLVPMIVIVLTSCSGSRSSEGSVTRGEYVYDFSSLKEMVARSIAVVEASVLEVQPGAVAAVEDEASIQYMDVTLRLDRVFAGTGMSSGDTISVQELPTVELSLTPNGSHGFFFLTRDNETGSYLIINPEGRFLVDGSGQITSSEADPDDWVVAIEKETPEQLRHDIASAVGSDGETAVSATPAA